MLEHHLKPGQIWKATDGLVESRSIHSTAKDSSGKRGGAWCEASTSNVDFVVRVKSRKSEYGPTFFRVGLLL